MRRSAFALSFALLGVLAVVGCSSDGGTTETPPPDNAGMPPMAGGGAPPGMGMPGGVAPAGGAGPGGVALNAGGGARRPTSFDSAPESMKKMWGSGAGQAPMGGQMPGAGGAGLGGPKPDPIDDGRVALAARKDPFESIFRQVVQITPAWDYVIAHRTERPFNPTPPTPGPGPGGIEDLPPLPPVPRRVAGVFYNGGITAIIESGAPPTSDITIVQPGAEVESGIPGIPPLTVESISMESLILRARDGRTVEVKLSGLAPTVRDALRQQFSTGSAGGAMGPGGSMGPGGMGPGGAMGPGGMGPGRGGGGGGSGASTQ